MAVDIRTGKKYAVVIDTDQYAGNFERLLTAYCTGRIGDCGVGDELIPLFVNDFGIEELDDEEDPFWDIIDYVPDERGCSCPCSIYQNKNMQEQYSSVIIFFFEQPSKKQIEIIEERAKKYSNDPRVKEAYEYHAHKFNVQNVYVIEIETTIKKIL